ncbi:MAG: patatin-like phospholipase family protein [Cyclobacteriaceae bacterium]|nr:patatin-like phospholipase family protein [Cyclobacteriaceae bacterium HetDA_MAG_MS6]
MKVGLALSGGGARGIAHLGMIKALEEEGLTFDAVAGASAGALIGALYCYGYPPDEIVKFISKTNFLKIFKPALNWRGLLKLESGHDELRKYLEQDNFSALKTPLIIAATDVRKGVVKYFKKGKLIKPILASCCIPVLFDPVSVKGVHYIDGGIMDNLPVSPIKKKVDYIIGLHCNPLGSDYKVSSWKDLMERSLLMAISSNTYVSKRRCDLFWEPPGLVNFKVLDFKKAMELYKIGYEYGKQQLKEKPIFDLIA